MNIPTLHGPGELLATIPHLLGYTPQESVVIVGVGERGRLGVLMRIDRDDCLIPDVVDAMARAIATQLVQDAARLAVLVSYTEADVRVSCEASDALRCALTEAVPAVDTWAVTRGRFFAPGCADVMCCPEGGAPIPHLSDSHAMATMRVHGMRGAHPRATVPWGTAESQAKRRSARAADRWESKKLACESQWRQMSFTLWRTALLDARVDPPAVPDPGIGKLIAALADVRVRDAVIVSLIPGADNAVEDVLAGRTTDEVAGALDSVLSPFSAVMCETQVVDAIHQVVSQCVAHCRRKEAAPLSTLLALVEWWQGRPLSSISWCESALSCTPDYRLAKLIQATVLAGLEPGWKS